MRPRPLLSEEPEAARLVLRDLVDATVGFEQLAELTHKPSKSLHRRLAAHGNPSMNNLAASLAPSAAGCG
jgi:DNA-binding phage protein